MIFYGLCIPGNHKRFFVRKRIFNMPKPVGPVTSRSEMCGSCFRRLQKMATPTNTMEVTNTNEAPKPGPGQITGEEAMKRPRSERRKLAKVNNGLKIPGSTQPFIKAPKTRPLTVGQKVDIRHRPKATPQKP